MREEKRTRFIRIAGAAIALCLSFAGRASAQFFDWDERGTTAPAPFSPSPFLYNNAASAASVQSQLTTLANNGYPLAVRVVEPLTNPAAIGVFNSVYGGSSKKIQFVFADFESAAAVGNTRALSDQVQASTQSSNAFVGNFNFYPNLSTDSTRPAGSLGTGHSFQIHETNSSYTDSRGGGSSGTGKQVAGPALYTGSPDYRNPAAGNSGAPNLRSALFTLPIQRLTFASNGVAGRGTVPTTAGQGAFNTTPSLLSSTAVIPYVTRFNNFGNASLDSDGNSANGFRFVPGQATGGLTGAQTANQMLSRGDFKAQILHYRMRGATGYNLFSSAEQGGSVVGYSHATEQSDVAVGNAASSVANTIFNSGNYAFANLSNVIGDSGGFSGDDPAAFRSTELAGATWSGVYNTTGAGRRLVILLSNMSAVQKTVDFPNNIGGFALFHPANDGSLNANVITDPDGSNHGTDDFLVNAGQHRLLNFTLRNSRWELDYSSFGLTDSAGRNDIGIPEPTSISLLGLVGMGLLGRRRRAAKA